MKKHLAAVALAALVLSACGSEEPADSSQAEAPEPSSVVTSAAPAPPSAAATPAGPESIDVDVPWQNYAPEVRTRIEGLYAAKDCAGLQGEFDIADGNNEAQQARTGENNADLLGYLDTALRQADCY